MGFGDPGSARLPPSELVRPQETSGRPNGGVGRPAPNAKLTAWCSARGGRYLGCGLLGLGSGQANDAVRGRCRLFALCLSDLHSREINNLEVAFQRLLESQRGDELVDLTRDRALAAHGGREVDDHLVPGSTLALGLARDLRFVNPLKGSNQGGAGGDAGDRPELRGPVHSAAMKRLESR